MSDIVARLHAMIDANYGDVAADSVYGSAMSDAADEIDRLRAALREIGYSPGSGTWAAKIARAALQETKHAD